MEFTFSQELKAVYDIFLGEQSKVSCIWSGGYHAEWRTQSQSTEENGRGQSATCQTAEAGSWRGTTESKSLADKLTFIFLGT